MTAHGSTAAVCAPALLAVAASRRRAGPAGRSFRINRRACRSRPFRSSRPTPSLYQLIRQPRPIADRNFEIRFLDPGVEASAFMFG